VHRRLREAHRVEDAFAPGEPLPAVDARRGFRPDAVTFVAAAPGASASESVFKLTRELEEGRSRRDGARNEELAAQGRLREAERALEAALLERSSLREAVDLARGRSQQFRHARAEAEQARSRAASAVNRLALERNGSNQRLEALAASVAGLESALTVVETRLAHGSDELIEAQRAWSAVDEVVRLRGDHFSDARVKDAQARERVRALEQEQAQHAGSAAAARTRVIRMIADREQIAERREAAERSLGSERGELDRAIGEAAAEEQRLRERRERLDAAAAVVTDREVEAHEARRIVEAAASALRENELASERAKSDLEHADGSLLERFELSASAARAHCVEGGMTPALQEELTRVVEQIERLGPVNPAAEEEFAEATQRQGFLSEQKADLEKAIDDLEAAIRKMDKLSRDLFEETFKEVDAEFQRIFPELFRGGRARLELTEPDNMLETGIEIVAQPPGKRFQNMNLLSGGEKALTAVSLIFAIFRTRPTPFCVLDEVDAPLDEANVTRFAEAVRRMSTVSQILVITHSKRTMEAADTLYGVTMEEPGVSKVIGVRLNTASSEGTA
jgi:chromosome segregation protein